MRSLRARVLAGLLVVLLLLPGCVQFNETAYELNRHIAVAAEPVVQVLLLVPEPLMDRVRLFLRNLRYGDVVVNQFLQGKPELAVRDLARWVVNSTAGIGGLFDVATDLGLEEHEEDFGQTLAVWGFPQGRYLVLPVIGPTTDRDLVGFGISFFTNPTFWVEEPLVGTPVTVLSYANRALEAREGLSQLATEAADPYVFVREAYLQRRRFLIYDGQPPTPTGEEAGLGDLDLESLEELEDLDLPEDAPSEEEDAAATPEATPPDSTPDPDDLPGLEDVPDPDALPGLEEAESDATPAFSEPVRHPDDLPGLDEARRPRAR